MKTSMTVLALVALLALACTDQAPPVTSFGGEWIGTILDDSIAVPRDHGELAMSQHGDSLIGTLSLASGRVATVAGSRYRSVFTARLSFVSPCAYDGQTEATLVSDGAILIGRYAARDCLGLHTGTYTLLRR